jgi:hypothetical protein
MGYLVVENFGDGLDSRRSFITTKPGSLIKCKNAHITRGKEIEKRKRFALFATLPNGTFGLHSSGNSLYTFGSIAQPAGMPVTVNYVRLQAANAAAAMTELIATETFNGRIYAIAKFSDGTINHFYNGARVTAWDTVSNAISSASAVASYFAESLNEETYFDVIATGSNIVISGPINTPITFTLVAQNGGAATANDQTLTQTTSQEASETQGQITTISVFTGAAFDPRDFFSITASIPSLSYLKTFTITAASAGVGSTIKTFSNKMYSTTSSLLYFCKIAKPTEWGTFSPAEGAGFISLTSQDGGAENLTAIGVYQGKLAVFSRRNIQVWTMDPDPTKNIQTQTLSNIGTFASKSVVAFGDVDVFFLSESGVRSLRARDASNAATVSDIGTAIDTLIQSEMSGVSEEVRNSAIGIIEPTDGRYWLAIGNKIYVFSYFPGSNVSAWSVYEPGFAVSAMTYSAGKVFLRSGNLIYLYGGVTGLEYDSSEVEIELPYLDGGKPAHTKTIQAIDMACEGTWSVSVGMDVSAPTQRDLVGSITNSSYMLGRILHYGIGTHIGVRLVSNANGYARIGNLALHYTIAGAE